MKPTSEPRNPTAPPSSVARRTTEQLEKETVQLIKSGYAGRLPGGKIVDRRIHRRATAIPASKHFGIPSPRPLAGNAPADRSDRQHSGRAERDRSVEASDE